MIPSQGLSWVKSPICLLLVRFQTLNPGTDHIDGLVPVNAEHFHLAKKKVNCMNFAIGNFCARCAWTFLLAYIFFSLV